MYQINFDLMLTPMYCYRHISLQPSFSPKMEHAPSSLGPCQTVKFTFKGKADVETFDRTHASKSRGCFCKHYFWVYLISPLLIGLRGVKSPLMALTNAI